MRPEQAGVVARALRVAGVEAVGAGGPRRSGVEAARALGVPLVDDLRAGLASASADLILLADPDDLGLTGDRSGADAVLEARARGVVVASLEPIPSSAVELAGGRWSATTGGVRAVDTVRVLPMTRRWGAFRELGDVLENFGRVRTARLTLDAPPTLGSLAARAFDAFELLLAVLGEPESIDAAFAAPDAAPGVHAVPGESLRGLSGTLSALVRTSDGRAATVGIGNIAPADHGALTLLGPGGRLEIDPAGLRWFAPDGSLADQGREPALHEASEGDRAADRIGRALADLLDPSRAASPPIEIERVLACVQAAVLSTRTAQPESPGTIRRMVGVA